MQDVRIRQFSDHSRDWRSNLYVYPVISRRSRGLSIGINLNPDAACNFDCIYCQVDRSKPPRVREVDAVRLENELESLMTLATSGELFRDSAFSDVPNELRVVCDLAFSGDGEPTTCRQFHACVELVAACKRRAGLDNAKLVLITDACYLTRPQVEAGLCVMDENNGEIWAKLDAGTEEYYQKVNRPNYSLAHVVGNIKATAKRRAIVVQSLFMRIHGTGPSESELDAYVDRLREVTHAGGTISEVHVYTVARKPAEAFVSPLDDQEIDDIARLVKNGASLSVAPFYGSS